MTWRLTQNEENITKIQDGLDPVGARNHEVVVEQHNDEVEAAKRRLALENIQLKINLAKVEGERTQLETEKATLTSRFVQLQVPWEKLRREKLEAEAKQRTWRWEMTRLGVSLKQKEDELEVEA